MSYTWAVEVEDDEFRCVGPASVSYYVARDTTVRADGGNADGTLPEPLETGTLMTC